MAHEKSKCKNIMKEDYGQKEYINKMKIEDVRFMFKGRVGLLPFAGNYMNERRDLLDRLEEEERDAPSLGNWDS